MTYERTAYHHGHSVAAWTAVAVIIVAFLVGAFAVVAASPVTFVVACALVVLGVVVGKVMAMAGFGQMAGYHVQEPADTSWEGPTGQNAPAPSDQSALTGQPARAQR